MSSNFVIKNWLAIFSKHGTNIWNKNAFVVSTYVSTLDFMLYLWQYNISKKKIIGLYTRINVIPSNFDDWQIWWLNFCVYISAIILVHIYIELIGKGTLNNILLYHKTETNIKLSNHYIAYICTKKIRWKSISKLKWNQNRIFFPVYN